MTKKIGQSLIILALLASVAGMVLAAWTPEDFDSFTGSGFAPAPTAGQLDSDAWIVAGLSAGSMTWGDTRTDPGDFARGTSSGGETTGGIYAFEVGAGDYALGVQPSGSDFTPGAFSLRVQNTTGSAITQVYVEYEIWALNNADYSNSLNFSYSVNGTDYTLVPSLDYASTETADVSPVWEQVDRTTTISGLNVADGEYIYLNWDSDDVSGSGSRDELALDDVEVRINAATAVNINRLVGSSPFFNITAMVALAAGLVVLRKRH